MPCPEAPRDPELSFDFGCTARPKKAMSRQGAMSDILGSALDDARNGDLQLYDLLDLYNHTALVLADMLGTIRDEFVPSYDKETTEA